MGRVGSQGRLRGIKNKGYKSNHSLYSKLKPEQYIKWRDELVYEMPVRSERKQHGVCVLSAYHLYRPAVMTL